MPKLSEGKVATRIQDLGQNTWNSITTIGSASHTYITGQIQSYTENPDNTLHVTAIILAILYARPYIALIAFIPTSLYLYEHGVINITQEQLALHVTNLAQNTWKRTARIRSASHTYITEQIQSYTENPRNIQAAGLAIGLVTTGIVTQILLREETPPQLNKALTNPLDTAATKA